MKNGVLVSQALSKRRIVVVGNGMVGCKLLERLVGLDTEQDFEIATFCEESLPAYDRVHLSEYFAGKNADDLIIKSIDWYIDNDIHLLLGGQVVSIDRGEKSVLSANGMRIGYDQLVMATGSVPFVPPIEGIDKTGVFVYRTLADLDAITSYAEGRTRVAVIGGGLLGLEAASAMLNLGLDTTVVEFASHLMPRQLDEAGGRILKGIITSHGIEVLTEANTRMILGDEEVTGLVLADGTRIDVDMVVVSAGIRPRDELAEEAGLTLGPRGGVLVDETMQSSDPDIYAVGEVAAFDGMTYGLVAPGYDMADVAAHQIMGRDKVFAAPDLSTKLKLIGVDVASFGDALGAEPGVRTVSFENAVGGVYKKLVVSEDGKKLVGGILVGEADEYNDLVQLMRNEMELPEEPEALILSGVGGSGSALAQMELPDSAQICSCENVTKGDIAGCVQSGCDTVGKIKSSTRAGTGCGGCAPMLKQILTTELESMGRVVVNHICEHFAYSRAELLAIIRVKKYHTFEEVLASHGSGGGCETCKPSVAGILASLWNEHIDYHDTIQDTNDRFMANIQRGGTYSVVPRIPGGEITPEKLIVLGQVALKYDLYTKITGGQRVDLFGARVEQLPDIWEELIAAGFESGHAYGKALRTIKSCVGTNWCRFAVGDSVGLAIRLEERYRGIRSPHKLKSAVSGCVRECAEAQSKDFGVIATDNGWNLYVGGNGGANPRHADLLVTDLDEDTLVRTIDRYLMYYIQTADKLQRTARWIEAMEGGIDRLREVVCEDALGICSELEADMEALVGSYKCEWAEVVDDPERRKRFTHFVNSVETDSGIEFVPEREHMRPADWKNEKLPILDNPTSPAPGESMWIKVGDSTQFPTEGGACVKYNDYQVAVFQFESRGQWYATQNLCPHKYDMVLSRGLTGTVDEEPKVACPQHKKTFSLTTGEGLSDPRYKIQTYPVRIDGTAVMVLLPNWMQEPNPDAVKGSSKARCRSALVNS